MRAKYFGDTIIGNSNVILSASFGLSNTSAESISKRYCRPREVG